MLIQNIKFYYDFLLLIDCNSNAKNLKLHCKGDAYLNFLQNCIILKNKSVSSFILNDKVKTLKDYLLIKHSSLEKNDKILSEKPDILYVERSVESMKT